MKRSILPTRLGGLVLAGLVAAAALPVALTGCGEKIAIPEPSGVWANLAYSVDDTFEVPGVRQVLSNWGSVFVLTDGLLSKRNQDLEPDVIVSIGGDPTAFCVDETGGLLLVWEQDARQVLFFDTTDLLPLGAATLPEVESVLSMATCDEGMSDDVAGGRTFLYLTDEVSGLVRRYAVLGPAGDAFLCAECTYPAGALAWLTGVGARSVHEPGGLAVDQDNRLLVCEMDVERNWVIRFDSTPDSTDTTPIPPDSEPSWAGRAELFGEATCEPDPATQDYVLGNAPACRQDDWVGGPSDAEGEFDRPYALAIDGEGKIYVADQNNNRVQIFGATGNRISDFQVRDGLPTSLCVIDERPEGEYHYAAYIFLLTEGSDRVTRLVSSEHYLYLNDELPPYEE